MPQAYRRQTMTNVPPLIDEAHPPVDLAYDSLTIRGRGDGDIYGYTGEQTGGKIDIVVLEDLDIAKLLNDRPF